MSDHDDDDSGELNLVGFDVVRAVMIAQDRDALAAAYRRVFGTVEGRAVLFDILGDAMLAQERDPAMAAIERAHRDGLVALAARIFDRAGVSHLERAAGLSVVAEVTTNMERAHDNRNSDASGRSNIGDDTGSGGIDPGPDASEF